MAIALVSATTAFFAMPTGKAVGDPVGFSSSSSPPAAASYLFSIPASGGSLTGSDDQHLTLRLVGARNYLTRFTDVPLHSAQIVTATSFAANFEHEFPSAHPNAVLTFTPTGASIPVSVIVQVSRPRWSAPTHSWTFAAERIRKTGTTGTLEPPWIPNPRSFHDGTLVVDDSGGTVAPSVAFTSQSGPTSFPIVLGYTLSEHCSTLSLDITGFSSNFVQVNAMTAFVGVALSAGDHVLRYYGQSPPTSWTIDGSAVSVSSWSGVVIPDGSYTATLSCTDAMGNTSTASLPGILVRTSTPTPAIISPTPGATVTGPFTISYLLQSPTNGTVQFAFEGPTTLTYNVTPPTANGYPVTLMATVDPTILGLASGTYTITIETADSLGNPPASSSIQDVTIHYCASVVCHR